MKLSKHVGLPFCVLLKPIFNLTPNKSENVSDFSKLVVVVTTLWNIEISKHKYIRSDALLGKIAVRVTN